MSEVDLNLPADRQVIRCPRCGGTLVLRTTSRLTYADGQPRRFLGCSNYPSCSQTLSVHQDGRPMGLPADDATKRARMAAHHAFDPLWREGFYDRKAAYGWLARQLGVAAGDCHIGVFDAARCGVVVEVSSREHQRCKSDPNRVRKAAGVRKYRARRSRT